VRLHTWCPPFLTTKQVTMKIEKQIYENNLIKVIMKYKFKFDIGKFRYMIITESDKKKVYIYKRYLYFFWKQHCAFPLRELKQACVYLEFLQNR